MTKLTYDELVPVLDEIVHDGTENGSLASRRTRRDAALARDLILLSRLPGLPEDFHLDAWPAAREFIHDVAAEHEEDAERGARSDG